MALWPSIASVLSNYDTPRLKELRGCCLGRQGGEGEMVDRRIFERISASIPLRVIDSSSNKEAEAVAFDVSAKGLGIVSREPLSLGDDLELWLKMPDKKAPFYTRGAVAWTKLDNKGKCRAGISLEKAELMGISRIFR